MKKAIFSLTTTLFLTVSLYANSDHSGDHMHNGKMMNHMNPNNMTTSQMVMMEKHCKEMLNKNSIKSSLQNKQLNEFETYYYSKDFAGE